MKFIDVIKEVLKDPLGFLPSKDAVAKQLNSIELTKLLVPVVALIGSGLTVDHIAEFLTQNQSSFGIYGGTVAAVAALIVQFNRLRNQGKTE